MAKEHISKEQLFNKMKDMSVNGILTTTKKKIANKLGLVSAASNSFVKYLKELEDEGLIKLISEAKNLGGGKWTENIWEIKMNDEVKFIESIDENFKGIKVKLFKTEIGYAVSFSDIAKSLKTSADNIYKIIDRNNELFNSWVVDITSNGQKLKGLNRDGIIGLVMKISYNRLEEKQKQRILEFQKWAIEKLGVLISNGKVELTEQEHSKAQNDVGFITGMTVEQIDKMFNDISSQFDKLLTTAKSTIKSINKDRDRIEYEKIILKRENQRWINNTLALKEKLYSSNIL